MRPTRPTEWPNATAESPPPNHRPCDRFVYQLIEYEKELAQPYRFSLPQLSALVAAAALTGIVVGKKLM